jgi:hypothetical protein
MTHSPRMDEHTPCHLRVDSGSSTRSIWIGDLGPNGRHSVPNALPRAHEISGVARRCRSFPPAALLAVAVSEGKPSSASAGDRLLPSVLVSGRSGVFRPVDLEESCQCRDDQWAEQDSEEAIDRDATEQAQEKEKDG